MLTTSTVKVILRKSWWSLVKNEVARVIAIRGQATDDGLRPSGSGLAQDFIDTMHELPELREYVHYLTTRGWLEILSDIQSDLSPEMEKALHHEEGARWFREFQRFLIHAWKRSAPEAEADQPILRIHRRLFEIARDELALHLEKKVHPALMANAMLELMRDPSNDASRRTALLCATFMAPRTWPEVVKALSDRFSEDLSRFVTPAAAAYFEQFKEMIVAQIEDFYESAVADRKKHPEDQPDAEDAPQS